MIFVDSNVWLYGLLLPPHPTKRQRALELCATPEICVSSQVVNEVLANYRKKQPAAEADIRNILNEFYSEYLVLEILQSDIQTASELRRRVPIFLLGQPHRRYGPPCQCRDSLLRRYAGRPHHPWPPDNSKSIPLNNAFSEVLRNAKIFEIIEIT